MTIEPDGHREFAGRLDDPLTDVREVLEDQEVQGQRHGDQHPEYCFSHYILSQRITIAHQHGPEGKRSHQGIAFTTMLDPQPAIAQSQIATNAIVKLGPASKTQISEKRAFSRLELRFTTSGVSKSKEA